MTKRRTRWPLLLIPMVCPIGCAAVAISALRGCMTEHSRPVGHRDITFDISPDGRTLAFAGVGEGGRDLYLFDLKSRRVTPLTHSDDYEIGPAFSGDGKRLVFTRGTPGIRADQLCVMDLATREVVQVTNADENVSSPVFLPDGKRVLCTVETEYRWGGLASSWDEGGELRIVDLQTREQFPLRTRSSTVFKPRVSRDGKWIAWIDSDAFVAPIANPLKAFRVMSKASSLAIDADGMKLAISAGEYAPDHKIYFTDQSAKTSRTLFKAPGGCFDPVFSHDHQYVYFLIEQWQNGPNGVPTKSLVKARTDGSEVTQVASFNLFENPLSR